RKNPVAQVSRFRLGPRGRSRRFLALRGPCGVEISVDIRPLGVVAAFPRDGVGIRPGEEGDLPGGVAAEGQGPVQKAVEKEEGRLFVPVDAADEEGAAPGAGRVEPPEQERSSLTGVTDGAGLQYRFHGEKITGQSGA